MENQNSDPDRKIFRVLSFGKLQYQDNQQSSVRINDDNQTQIITYIQQCQTSNLQNHESRLQFSTNNTIKRLYDDQQHNQTHKFKQTLQKICKVRQQAQIKKTKINSNKIEELCSRESEEKRLSPCIRPTKSLTKVSYNSSKNKQATEICTRYTYFPNKYQKMVENTYNRRINQISTKLTNLTNDYDTLHNLSKKLGQSLYRLLKITQLESLIEGVEIIDHTTIDQLFLKLNSIEITSKNNDEKISKLCKQSWVHSQEEKINEENSSTIIEEIKFQEKQQKKSKEKLIRQVEQLQRKIELKNQLIKQKKAQNNQQLNQNLMTNHMNRYIENVFQITIKNINQNLTKSGKQDNSEVLKKIENNEVKNQEEEKKISKKLQQAELKVKQYRKQLDNKNQQSHQLSRTIFELQQRLLSFNEKSFEQQMDSLKKNNLKLNERNEKLNTKIEELQNKMKNINQQTQKFKAIQISRNIYEANLQQNQVIFQLQQQLTKSRNALSLLQSQENSIRFLQQQLQRTRNSQTNLIDIIKNLEKEISIKNSQIEKIQLGRETKRTNSINKSPRITVTGKRNILKQEKFNQQMLTPRKNNSK